MARIVVVCVDPTVLLEEARAIRVVGSEVGGNLRLRSEAIDIFWTSVRPMTMECRVVSVPGDCGATVAPLSS